jgi:hypothetical protein
MHRHLPRSPESQRKNQVPRIPKGMCATFLQPYDSRVHRGAVA